MSVSTPSPEHAQLIHDWNDTASTAPMSGRSFDLFDESLRDGLQSPSVADPSVEEKLRIIQLMADLGIGAADVGLPCAGQRAYDDVTAIATYVRDNRLPLRVCAAGRTVVSDMAPIADIQQKVGIPLTAYAFIGSSPIRQYAEGWTVEHIREASQKAIDFAVKENLDICYVTEDTTRSSPATLEVLFRSAIEHGASRLCLCDTVGHATPDGVRRLIAFTKALIAESGADVKIDWHGHNDRGLAVVNTLFALEYGADRLHGTAMGIGERVGNTAIDQLLVNLKLLGVIDRDLTKLVEFVRAVATATKVGIPINYPLVGEDAFRTATGVHAAAIIKAKRRGDEWLADRVYSAVPAGEFGKGQTIDVGPMSGMSNVTFWLEQQGMAATEELGKFILAKAKASAVTLSDAAIRDAVREYEGAAAL
ncbi:LeuA family protein [Vulgatibacter incomptus]|uniref:2-isopropylmalate synthase n=1 Tax=Vulgatibacter incomptus TaxID=1391653 RepID=A0A0K1PDK7_9BACT|nr:LeuA family protein [Vulgatibacter incomptus]AKU91491.1 2-isopropylmalate synthase [Vulgatibacter incomptus]